MSGPSLIQYSGLVTNPATGAVLTDTGALPAMLAQVIVTGYMSVAVAGGDIEVAHRNAANNADVEIVRLPAQGTQNPIGQFTLYFQLAANERIVVRNTLTFTGTASTSLFLFPQV